MSASVSSERIAVVIDRCHTSLGIKKRFKCPPPYIQLVIMPARLISGSRGGNVLIHQRFKYQKNRRRGDIIYWRCWKEECRAPLKTNLFDLEDQNTNINVLNEPEHTHAHEDVQITRSEIKNRLVQKVKQDPSLPIKKIYDSVVRAWKGGRGC